MEQSKTTLLREKITLIQPTKSYRAGTDAVFLAASIQAKAGEHLLDVGCGVGTVSLCIAYRLQNVIIDGMDREKKILEMARQNAIENNLQERLSFYPCDIHSLPRDFPEGLRPGSYDQVVSNPPYFEEKASTRAADPYQSHANIQLDGTLKDWMDFCLKMLKHRGTLSLIFPTSRLSDLLLALDGRIGNMVLYPLWSKEGIPAKRFILSGKKTLKPTLTLLPGLIVHEPDGSYTTAAKAILEEGMGIDLRLSF